MAFRSALSTTRGRRLQVKEHFNLYRLGVVMFEIARLSAAAIYCALLALVAIDYFRVSIDGDHSYAAG